LSATALGFDSPASQHRVFPLAAAPMPVSAVFARQQGLVDVADALPESESLEGAGSSEANPLNAVPRTATQASMIAKVASFFILDLLDWSARNSDRRGLVLIDRR
jgi:hypothetical protein